MGAFKDFKMSVGTAKEITDLLDAVAIQPGFTVHIADKIEVENADLLFGSEQEDPPIVQKLTWRPSKEVVGFVRSEWLR